MNPVCLSAQCPLGGTDRIACLFLLLLLLATAPAPSEAFRIAEQTKKLAGTGAGAPLCSPSIVAEACGLFSPDDEAPTSVTASDLQEMLSAEDAAIAALWAELGLDAAASVSCPSLCETVVDLLAKTTTLPPAHDVGCVREGGRVVCNVDLSPESLAADAQFEGDLPDFHDRKLIHKGSSKRSLTGVSPRAGTSPKAGGIPRVAAPTKVTYTSRALLRRVANLFRIYPLTGASVAEDLDSGSLAELGANKTKVSTRWIKKVNLEALKYVENAVRLFRHEKTRKGLTRWFGESAFTDRTTRREVQRILNSIDNMLDNVHYVYPGPDCTPKHYAYVYPDGTEDCSEHELQTESCTKNKDGQFIFYICDLAKESSPSKQIEMLTHEGSHHATAYTQDVCLDDDYDPDDEDAECEVTAYGRKACRQLARDYPDWALTNADNVCYYIQDVTDKEL